MAIQNITPGSTNFDTLAKKAIVLSTVLSTSNTEVNETYKIECANYSLGEKLITTNYNFDSYFISFSKSSIYGLKLYIPKQNSLEKTIYIVYSVKDINYVDGYKDYTKTDFTNTTIKTDFSSSFSAWALTLSNQTLLFTFKGNVINKIGNSGYFKVVITKPKAIDTILPPPNSFLLEALNTNESSFSLMINSDLSETGVKYLIEKAIGAGAYSTVATIDRTSSYQSYQISGLSASTTYRIKVTAKDSSGSVIKVGQVLTVLTTNGTTITDAPTGTPTT